MFCNIVDNVGFERADVVVELPMPVEGTSVGYRAMRARESEPNVDIHGIELARRQHKGVCLSTTMERSARGLNIGLTLCSQCVVNRHGNWMCAQS